MTWKVALLALASLPACAFGATVVRAAYAATVVGHWPYYAHPDPKTLPDSFLDPIFVGAFVGGVCSVFVFPAVMLILSVLAMVGRRGLARVHAASIAVFLSGLGLWAADLWIRGGRSLLEWVVD